MKHVLLSVLLLLALVASSWRTPAARLAATSSAPSAPIVHHLLPLRQQGDEDDIPLLELLSTCIDAAQQGCTEIRRAYQESSGSRGCIIEKVEYKVQDDPRSALTAADLAAHTVVVAALERAWPGLRIVSEEDATHSVDSSIAESAVRVSRPLAPTTPAVLRRDLCRGMDVSSMEAASLTVPLSHVTVFVDPLDGTREFVEGRVWNVQTLIGIAVNGDAVAGAVGLPFDGGSADSAAAIVYAVVGAGPPQVHGERGPSHEGMHRGGVPATGARPLLVAGDAYDPALMAAYAAALGDGGRTALVGGTGRKCLAVVEGRADVAIMNLQSNSWDTCAPEALVHAAGGELTDLFGERLVYLADPTLPASHLNKCGVIACAPAFLPTARAVGDAMRSNASALQLLQPWGLRADDVTDREVVMRVLRERRRALHNALATPAGLGSLQRLQDPT